MNITSFLPDVSLLFFIALIIFLKLFGINHKRLSMLLFPAALITSFILLLQQYYFPNHTIFYGSFAVDYFGISIKTLSLFIFSCLYYLTGVKSSDRDSSIIYFTLIFALFISISSDNILLTYISFEVISLCYFVILKQEPVDNINSFYRSWIISSSLMLFGISIFYGLFGSLNYNSISRYISTNPVNSLTLTISVLMIFTGFAFRLFIFPLQSVISGISEKISSGKSSLILITSAIAGVSGLTRFLFSAFNESNTYNTSAILHSVNNVFNCELFIILIFGITVLTSSLLLYLKRDLVKINLYIFLVNLSLIFPGLSLMQYSNLSIITLVLVQTLLPFTAIAVIINFLRVSSNINTKFDLKGLFYRYPFIAIIFIINLLSMAGFPLTLGFITRLYIFSSISQTYSLLVISLSVISSIVIYYKIFQITIISFSKNIAGINITKIKLIYVMILSVITLFLLIFGIFSGPLTYILNIISNIIYF